MCVRACVRPSARVLTAVGVDELGVDEAHFEVVEHGGLVQVAERREVVLAHQDVRVPEVGQVLRLGVQLMLQVLHSFGVF